MKKFALLFILLILFSNIQITTSQPNPVGVAGYVWLEDGSPAPVGITVVVKNENSGEYANTTTTEHEGNTMYATSIYANDGDTITVSCSYSNYYGSNFTTVNLSLTTQWCNLTLNVTGGIPPFAFFSYSPKKPFVGDEVRFYDSSYDTDGWIVYRTWDFGDGERSHEKNPIHVFTEAGTYKVTLTVKDNDGLTKSTWKNIIVREREEGDEDIIIPPIPPPKYPEEPYTVPEMYEMLKLPEKITTGKVVIAVIDTGFIPRVYEDLENNISVDMRDVIGKSVSKYDVFDEHGHGTWVSYAVHWATENYMPNAVEYSIRAFSKDGSASQADILEAFRIAESIGADVISCSWGYFGGSDDIISKKVEDLRDKGIVVVCAGGNYGPAPNTITVPATSPSTIAVGAVDPMKTIDVISDDRVTNWSSRGPVYGLKEVKPDVVAGGESIKGPWLYDERIVSGTSMATPIVAGSCAYMIAKERILFDWVKKLYFWNRGKPVYLLEESIEKTARTPAEGTKFDYGHGVPNIESALSEFHSMLLWALIKILILYLLIVVAIIAVVIYIIKKRRDEVEYHI